MISKHFLSDYIKAEIRVVQLRRGHQRILTRAIFALGFSICSFMTILYLMGDRHAVPIAIYLLTAITFLYFCLMMFLYYRALSTSIASAESDKFLTMATLQEAWGLARYTHEIPIKESDHPS